MSSKYLIDAIRTSALQGLRRAYPEELCRFDSGVKARAPLGHVITVIKVAYEINEKILLPSAFYTLSCFSTSLIRDFDLPPPILAIHRRGKNELAWNLAVAIGTIQRYCSRAHQCKHAQGFLTDHANRILSHNNMEEVNPLEILMDIMRSFTTYDACDTHQRELNRALHWQREMIWESLPDAFGLGSWKTLREAADI